MIPRPRPIAGRRGAAADRPRLRLLRPAADGARPRGVQGDRRPLHGRLAPRAGACRPVLRSGCRSSATPASCRRRPTTPSPPSSPRRRAAYGSRPRRGSASSCSASAARGSKPCGAARARHVPTGLKVLGLPRADRTDPHADGSHAGGDRTRLPSDRSERYSAIGDEGSDLRKNGLTRFEWPVNLASPGERTVFLTRATDSFEPDSPAPESGIGKTSAASILGWDRAGLESVQVSGSRGFWSLADAPRGGLRLVHARAGRVRRPAGAIRGRSPVGAMRNGLAREGPDVGPF